uniref:Receptor expression-enhancing protein n=1 Tax=Geospiza parvula TaxID=87175 RepID=A0A8C3NQK4_GEOPR
MVSWILSRVIELLFGMLYPAYASYKAVKTKNIREYVRWMMYWIVFALFMATETFTDLLISWLPFYYEVKMAFVIWLLSPYTQGASLLYRRFVHPTLARREKDIDAFLVRARERSYETRCASARGASTWRPPPPSRRPPRARARWPGGSAASACTTCAPCPSRPPCTSRTRCTWRSRGASSNPWASAMRASRTRRSCGRTRRCPPRCPHAGMPDPCPAGRA